MVRFTSSSFRSTSAASCWRRWRRCSSSRSSRCVCDSFSSTPAESHHARRGGRVESTSGQCLCDVRSCTYIRGISRTRFSTTDMVDDSAGHRPRDARRELPRFIARARELETELARINGQLLQIAAEIARLRSP